MHHTMMQLTKEEAHQRCSIPTIHHTKDSQYQRCNKEAPCQRCSASPKYHHAKDAVHQIITSPKITIHQRCISPKIQCTKYDETLASVYNVDQMTSGAWAAARTKNAPKKTIFFIQSFCKHHVWTPIDAFFVLTTLYR